MENFIFCAVQGTSPIINPAGIYFFKINDENTRTMSEIYSKLTVKTP